MTKTLTRETAAATVAPVDADAAPLSADDMRAAMSAYDAATTYADGSSLADAVLARFRFHAERYATSHEGEDVLPDNHRADVRGLVFLEAFGSLSAPKRATATPSQVSVGQYVARFGTVATSLDYGMAWLTSPATAKEAYTSIREGKSDDDAAAALRKLNAWTEGLTVDESRALAVVRGLLTSEPGKSHKAAWIKTLAD